MRPATVLSMLLLAALCVATVVSASAYVGLSGWSTPMRSDTIGSTSGTPTALEFNGLIHLVYQSGITLYYLVSSPNGTTFGSLTKLNIDTQRNPTLVVVNEIATGASRMLLLASNADNPQNTTGSTLLYSVFQSTSNPFPSFSPLRNISNVFGDIDGVYFPAKQSLSLVYISNNSASYNIVQFDILSTAILHGFTLRLTGRGSGFVVTATWLLV